MNATLERVRIEDTIDFVSSLEGMLTLRPHAGDGSPEISWGDVFFYFAPDGQVPQGQPFATIVTKDYPDDRGSRLDRAGAFRVNIGVGAAEFRRVTGHEPREPSQADPSTADVLFAHPVYGQLGWLAVVDPAERTSDRVRELLTSAHRSARARHRRRTSRGAS